MPPSTPVQVGGYTVLLSEIFMITCQLCICMNMEAPILDCWRSLERDSVTRTRLDGRALLVTLPLCKIHLFAEPRSTLLKLSNKPCNFQIVFSFNFYKILKKCQVAIPNRLGANMFERFYRKIITQFVESQHCL